MPRWYGQPVPRVRRLRREAPALELLAATLPELRLGLSEPAARTVAYEVFEKLGFGAGAVTDTIRVLALTGAGARAAPPPPPGGGADPSGLRSTGGAETARRAARPAGRMWSPRVPAWRG